MDLNLDPHLIDLRDRVAAFVRDEVIPVEPHDAKSYTDELVNALRAKARATRCAAPISARRIPTMTSQRG